MKIGHILFMLFCLFSCHSDDSINIIEFENLDKEEFNLRAYLEEMKPPSPTTRSVFFFNGFEGWDAGMTPEQRAKIRRMGRRPFLRDEYNELKASFPNLSYNNAAVCDPARNPYVNCIAYAVGIRSWLNVYTLSELTQLYAQAQSYGGDGNYRPYYNFENKAPVAYGFGSFTPSHAAKSLIDNSYMVSKLGANMTIYHTEQALMNGAYGSNRMQIYAKKKATWMSESINNNVESVHELLQENIIFTQYERTMIAEKAKKASRQFPQFNSVFEEWKEAFFSSFSSNTSTAKNLPQYDVLIKMGKGIIPLLIEKMISNDENFIALELYNDLQKNEKQKILYKENDPQKLEGMQQTAKKTIKKWIQGNL